MKILLINPPFVLPVELDKPQIFQPMGLAYIAAVLKKRNSVLILDANAKGWRDLKQINGQYYSGLTLNQIKQRIKEINPDIVGISIQFSINEKSALDVAKTVKQVNKNIIVIAGGPHPTVAPGQVLSNPSVDFVVIGEGEETIVELTQVIKEKAYNKLKQVNGIAYRQGDKVIKTQPREFIKDLDTLPFPARELLPMQEYFAAAKAGRGPRQSYTPHYQWASIFTSRGCPYNCIFCSIHLSMGRLFRARTSKNVIKEIQELIEKYKIKHINIEDDNITLNKQRFEKICDLIIESNLDFTWSAPNGLRADLLDDNLVKKMKESGCYRVFVAPESGVQNVVTNIIKKNLDLKKVEQAVILLKKYGIIVDGSFVIGLPGETKEDIKNTIKYALKLKKLGMSEAGFHIATPLYGTELYKIAKEKGYLRKDFHSGVLSSRYPLIETPEWTLDELTELQRVAGWLVNLTAGKRYSLMLKKILKIIIHPSKLISALKTSKFFIKNYFNFK